MSFAFRVLVSFSCVVSTISSNINLYRKTSTVPWTSCKRLNGLTSILKCYRECRDAFDELYLFSRDVTTGTCYCCDKKTGVDDMLIPEFERETFITGNCALRYKGYNYNNQKICLRYEETLKTYHEAADVCQREGGDLIRVDSISKHNIMRAFIEEQRLADRSEVWVQGMRDSNLVWRYHDSTDLNYTCLSDVSGNSNSNYMRAKSVDNYFCADNIVTYKAFYLCEMIISFI